MSRPSASTDRQVSVVTRDLVFRGKLAGALRALGWEPVRGAAPRAVVELGGPDDVARVRDLLAAGTLVVAFAPHVEAALLREARQAGAWAVPNSQLERALRERFGTAGEAG